MSVETKAAVTVAEMARMVGLSRARFYQLLGSAFPWPVYDVTTRRPLFVEEQQKVCLEVRRRNCGIDGKPILFYCRRSPVSTTKRPPKAEKPQVPVELLDGLRSLGLTATAAQVEVALSKLYPKGVVGIDHAELVRSVFIYLKRQNSNDNVAR
jgi:hypothetical protein